MKTIALIATAGLALVLSTNAFAAPLSSVGAIDATTDIRIMPMSALGSVDSQRAAAVAGGDVVQLQFVGRPTNPALKGELGNDGLEIADLVALYSDMDGVVWAFVNPSSDDSDDHVEVTAVVEVDAAAY
jgi:hypothetical protein